MLNYSRRDFLRTAGLAAASLAVPGCVNNFSRPAKPGMSREVLHDMRFTGPKGGWEWPGELSPNFAQTADGLLLRAGGKPHVVLKASGVHTYNGDSIELHFSLSDETAGRLGLRFQGGFEKAIALLDFKSKELSFSTSDWRQRQPVAKTAFELSKRDTHVLLIEKREGKGGLVKNVDFEVWLDGKKLLGLQNQDALPEMGVAIVAYETDVLLRRFVQRGRPSGIPEYLHIGGWQVFNRDNIKENLDSICSGLRIAAEKGVQLLVTPETSLTGLFPRKSVMKQPQPVSEAENKLRDFIRNLKNAPYLIVGLPVWEKSKNQKLTRYNVSRLYDPDGNIVATYPKIHSCEWDLWHGYRLSEFDIYGAPVTMHICHDSRYPEVWTLPVMFGARLIVHPVNPGGKVSGNIEVFKAKAGATTATSNAYYMQVGGGGGSHIVGPWGHVITISSECRKNVPTYPMIGEPAEELVSANIRVHDAYGYWPMRSFRASEQIAQSYMALYKAMGGKRH